MKEVFSLSLTNTKSYLPTHCYGLECLGYKGSQIWKNIPKKNQESKDLSVFKTYISNKCKDLCKCNLCKLYVTNLGYIEHPATQIPS